MMDFRKLLGQMTTTLDAFSEGKYDSRVEDPGDDQDAQVFNAIVGRIQDRVLRQASRNHALSVVMNQMQNGIIAVDGNLKVILVTPVAKKLLGIIGNPEGRLVSEASKDVRLDDGTTKIDNLDAQEYSTEEFMRDILERT